MKKIAYFFLISAFIFSCKEQTPPGLNLGGNTNSNDSLYEASVETAQTKKILMEEMTGVTCSNCPSGARKIESWETTFPGRVITVAIHAGSFTTPYIGHSKYDFRTEKGESILASLGGDNSKPGGAVDRQADNNGLKNQPWSQWDNLLANRIPLTTPLNIHLSSSYNPNINEVELLCNVRITSNLTSQTNLTVYVIENGIIDYQDDHGGVDDYEHKHVFRDCVSSILGDDLVFTNNNAGQGLQRRIKFNPKITGDNAWNIDNCYIVAFICDKNTNEVMHVEEVKVK